MRALFRINDMFVEADSLGTSIIIADSENNTCTEVYLNSYSTIRLFGYLSEPAAYYLQERIEILESRLKRIEKEIKEHEKKLEDKETTGFWREYHKDELEKLKKEHETTKKAFNIGVKLCHHAKAIHSLMKKLDNL